MSDILPVSLQNFLYSRKSELRKQQIIRILLISGGPQGPLLSVFIHELPLIGGRPISDKKLDRSNRCDSSI